MATATASGASRRGNSARTPSLALSSSPRLMALPTGPAASPQEGPGLVPPPLPPHCQPQCQLAALFPWQCLHAWGTAASVSLSPWAPWWGRSGGLGTGRGGAGRWWDDVWHWQEQLWVAAARQCQPSPVPCPASSVSRTCPGDMLRAACPPEPPAPAWGLACTVLPRGLAASTEV